MSPFKKPKPETPEEVRQFLYSSALRFLSFRDRFTSEVTGKLHELSQTYELGDTTSLIDQIVTSLNQSGYLNDEKNLEHFITYRLTEKLKGPLFIKRQLFLFGLPKAQIDQALRDFAPLDVQLDALSRYLKKHLKDSADPKLKLKLMRRLISRGFSPDIIRRSFDWQDFSE